MGEMVKMVVVLLVLSILSGYSLAYLNDFTKDDIESQELKFVKGPAILKIFDEAGNDPINDRFKVTDGEAERSFFVGNIDGKADYVAFESSGVGFGGTLSVMVGVDITQDLIHGVGVTTHEETAGIGSKAKDDPTFVAQFKGQPISNMFKVKADGGKVDAISGATVTSRGVSDALTKASTIYGRLKPQIVEQMRNLNTGLQ